MVVLLVVKKKRTWLTRLDDDVCLSGSFQVCRWGTAVMSCNVLNLQWLFKQWTTCVEVKRVVVRGFGVGCRCC